MNKKIFVILLSIVSIESLTISSQAHYINVIELKNDDNSSPIIVEGSLKGEIDVKGGVEYTYTAKAYDPDGDPIMFDFIWVNEIDPNDPGQYAATQYPKDYETFIESGPDNIVTATVTHNWPVTILKKDYIVRVIVSEDNDGDNYPNSDSEWAELDITCEGKIKSHFKNTIVFRPFISLLERIKLL